MSERQWFDKKYFLTAIDGIDFTFYVFSLLIFIPVLFPFWLIGCISKLGKLTKSKGV